MNFRLLFVPVSILLAILVWGVGPAAPVTDASVLIWLICSTVATALAPIYHHCWKRRFLDPILLLCTLQFIYFIFRAAIAWYFPAYTKIVLDSESAIAVYAIDALRLVTFCSCCIFWGSLVSLPLPRARIVTDAWNSPITSSAVNGFIAFASIALALRLFTKIGFEVADQNSYSAIISMIISLGLIALGLAVAFARTTGARLITYILLAGSFVTLYISSFKQPFVMVILYALIGMSFIKRRPPWKGIIAGALATIFIVFPVIEGQRRQFGLGLDSLQTGIDAYLDQGTVADDGVSGQVISALARASERFHGFESLVKLFERVPDSVPHEGLGAFALRASTSLVPRALYPDKPATARGEFFNSEILQLSPGAVVSSMAITQIGDGYYIGGFLAAGFVSLLLGIYARYLQLLLANFRAPGFAPYFCILLTPIVQLESDVILTWNTVAKLLLCYVLVWSVVHLKVSGSTSRRRRVYASQVAG